MVTETTLLDASGPASAKDGFYLVLLSSAGAVTFPVSPHKGLLIGRSRHADIQLDDPLASRKHARLDIGEDNSLIVVDLDSANGTRLRGAPVAPRVPSPIRPGDSIEIGSSMLLLLQLSASVAQLRVWSHQYFETRLAEACLRANVEGAQVGVVRARFDEEVGLGRLLPLLLEASGASLLASYEPREYELLVEAEDPEGVRERLATRLARAGIKGCFGISRFPRDGRDAYGLFDRANPRSTSVGAVAALSPPVDDEMARAIALAQRIAPSNINVLLQGETGVGKEVMTASIHRWSSRSGPLVCVNCAGLSETLLESDLFGHEKGSFTGATQKVGLLESANGGTVLLDEIGELPLALQAKMLRVLQDRSIRRVGGLREIPIDVRFIAATNRDLESEATRGAFRQDLFFRLGAATVVIPPLRARRSEIPTLAAGFVAEIIRGSIPNRSLGISRDAMAALVQYDWPGNIRELKNMLERAALLCSGEQIELEHLPEERLRGARRGLSHHASNTDTPPTGLSTSQLGERQRIIAALTTCAWNQTTAATLLGMPRRTLVSKLKAYQIPRPRGRRSGGYSAEPPSSRTPP